MEFNKITLNKNRGWRGLAELTCSTKEGKVVYSTIFSFSQDMWDDLLKGIIVIQDDANYYVIQFNNTDRLPKGQRSVLLKYFQANVVSITAYGKDSWIKETYSEADRRHFSYISNFKHNKNNHTTSDWNYVGIRVMPDLI